MSDRRDDLISVTPRRATSPIWIFALLIGGCLLFTVVLGLLYFGVQRTVISLGQPGSRISCSSNAKQLATGLVMYTQDYDEVLPPAAMWQTVTMPYIKNTSVLRCPDRPTYPSGYSYNSTMSLRKLKTVASPGAAPLFFESSLGAVNASDPLQSFTTPHAGMGYVAYVDGHVKAMATAPSPNDGLAPLKKKPAKKGKR
jgi:prepilin-type processing-associated H-X9-DG protein